MIWFGSEMEAVGEHWKCRPILSFETRIVMRTSLWKTDTAVIG